MLVKGLTSASLSAYWQQKSELPTMVNQIETGAWSPLVGFVGTDTGREAAPAKTVEQAVVFCRQFPPKADKSATKKPTKVAQLEAGRKHKRKPRIWRREPYYPLCVIATSQEEQIQRQAADEMFAALALQDGHDPEYIALMLHKVSPVPSPVYCQQIVAKADIHRSEILTAERWQAYIQCHPFAQELQLQQFNSQTLETK